MPFVFVQSTDHPEDRGHVEEMGEAAIRAHEAEIAANQEHEPVDDEGEPVLHVKNAGLKFRRMTDEEVAAWQAAEQYRREHA